MNTGIKKSKELFFNKKALKEAIEAMIDREAKKIEDIEAVIFSDLKKQLREVGLTVLNYGHYDSSRASVYGKGLDHIDIVNYAMEDDVWKIAYEDKERNDLYQKALNIINEFLIQLDTE